MMITTIKTMVIFRNNKDTYYDNTNGDNENVFSISTITILLRRVVNSSNPDNDDGDKGNYHIYYLVSSLA